ncbi:hypothetical protein [Promicromonospora sp. NPDC059942]|uniref:hypothetical protein n=1 Tax=Promicromonospora sp. NPDC059942 TaxID=3347009 RepID=UPI003664A735
MRRATLTATAAASVLLTGLVAVPAVAAPGDPMPGWDPRPEEAHREVAVAGSGRVFVDASSEGGYKVVSYLENGYGNDWVRTENDPGTWAEIATGENGYAVDLRFSADGAARYRTHDGSTWSDAATFYDDDVHATQFAANSAGDVAVLLRLHEDGGGGTVLARLAHGGQWVVQEVPGVPADVPADVALNDQGKTTLVWAAPAGETADVRRSVVRAGSTTLTPPTTVGTVNDPAPNLAIDTDGEGRETIIGGNLLWRQASTNQLPVYRLRASVHAQLVTGDSATRVVWPATTETGYAIRSVLFDDETQRPQTTLWSHTQPPSGCRADSGIANVALGVGMVPGGRSYLAVGLRRDIGTDDTCPDIASLLVVDRQDQVLGEEPLGYFANGEEFQVDAGAAGPVTVEFKNWDDGADPVGEDQPDGLYSLGFFQR